MSKLVQIITDKRAEQEANKPEAETKEQEIKRLFGEAERVREILKNKK